MRKCTNLIQSCDYFSQEVKLFISGNSFRNKNIIGGSLSLFSLAIMFSATIYFFLEFVQRSNATIITNQDITNKVEIDEIDKIPYMVRLSDGSSRVLDNPDPVYKIVLAYWWLGKNDTVARQYFRYIELEQCDLNKHFGTYRPLFVNYTDIETFKCPKFTQTEKLYGLYGDADEFSYLLYYISACDEARDGIKCESKDYVDKYLMETYLDFRTVDNAIESFKLNPQRTLVTGQRFPISNSVFKRIWMYYQSISYNTDLGYVFTDNDEKNFFQVQSYRADVDIRDYNNQAEEPGSFLWFTVSNSPIYISYYRGYMKAQNFLANVGGIIKGITILGMILTYIISEKYFYQDMINQNTKLYNLFNNHIKSNNSNLNKKLTNNVEYSINNKYSSNNKNIIDIDNFNSNNEENNDYNNDNSDRELKLSKLQTIKKKKTVKLHLKEILLPFCCFNKSIYQRNYDTGIKEINNQMNIANILNELYQFKVFKKLILDSHQNIVFEFLFSNPMKTVSPNKEFIEACNGLINKNEKTIIDIRLTEQLKMNT